MAHKPRLPISRPSYAGLIFPVSVMRVTLPFRDRSYRAYRKSPHRGLDFAPWSGSTGEPVRSPTYATVVEVNNYGNTRAIGNEVVLVTSLPYEFGGLDIDHVYRSFSSNEPFYMRFGHFQAVNVQVGDRIGVGHTIGWIGSTGKSSGPHVHMELRKGKYADKMHVDPEHLFSSAMVGYQRFVKYVD